MVSYTDFTATPRPAGLRLLDRIAAAWMRFETLQSRSEEIERLHALSDAELARRGIRRDRIVHHVFRDRLYL